MNRGINRQGLSKHHILFQRAQWEAQPGTKLLRTNPLFIPEIDPDCHDEVHKVVSCVPVLTNTMAEKTLKFFKGFETTDNHLVAIENLQRSIEATAREQWVDDVGKQLAELAIYAIDLQKPIVRQGILR